MVLHTMLLMNYFFAVTEKMEYIMKELSKLTFLSGDILNIVKMTETHMSKTHGDIPILEDILPSPLETVEQVESLSHELKVNSEYKKSMVQTLSQMGGASCGDTVRRMMRRIGTYGVWSQYSLVGRKRKRVFKTLDICNVIIKACINTHTNATERDVETSIADMLKNAPNKHGGNRYKGGEARIHVHHIAESDMTNNENSGEPGAWHTAESSLMSI
ncbi:uncharacterized protein [Procambarus clarkii]|uniref:uncharacterized protein n=7 Tax=Procambarus clarkii TaxID=6728 RepID=UPI0037441226